MSNFCSECGTENEEKFLYCKNCGATIQPPSKTEEIHQDEPKEEKEYSEPQSTYSSTGSIHSTPNGFIMDSIDGIPKEELSLFIGRKENEILPKFSKMELTHSKTSWCWPAAILGFLFGPLGAAIWFFYRKMYKKAILLSVIGTVLTILTSVLTFGSAEIDLEGMLNEFANGNFLGAVEMLNISENIYSMAASLIEDISSIATCIICGLFGYHSYKEHCVNKIREYRAIQGNQGFYRFGLVSIGGVSGGMVAVGLLIMVFASNIATIIASMVALLN